jgi:branched-chain amino acid transport system permease protein
MSLAALGVNILVGYCGQISLGSGAFMAVGAYGAYNFVCADTGHAADPRTNSGRPVRHGFFGILFGLPSLRVKGLYLAVATLAAQFFSDWMFLRIKWFTNNCAPRARYRCPTCRCWAFSKIETQPCRKIPALPVALLVVVLACWQRTWCARAIGREWMAIRDMDVAAAVIGIRPDVCQAHRVSPSARSSSAWPVGLWGFMLPGFLGTSRLFHQSAHSSLLFMVIIGGMGSIMGSFFGAAFIVVLPIFLNQFLPWAGELVGVTISTAAVAHTEFMIFGALIVWFLIAEPHGLAKLWSIAKQKLRIWPFPH